MKNNITKCPMCKKVIIIDEYRDHNCPSKITDVRTIGIAEDYGSLQNDVGDEVRLVKTVKGQILRLVKCDHPIPHNLPDQPRSDGFTHRELPDGDVPEPMKDGFKYYASFLVIR